MKATLTLTDNEIREAIKQYVERFGWKVSGTVDIKYRAGDQRDPGEYSASLTVESGSSTQGKD